MTYRNFSDTLNALRYGTLNDEAGRMLTDLVTKCESTGKVGELTIKLKLKPGKAGQMEVIDDITVKAPKEEKGSTIMFATPEGNLQREDPRQMNLDGLRTVDSGPAELRRVG